MTKHLPCGVCHWPAESRRNSLAKAQVLPASEPYYRYASAHPETTKHRVNIRYRRSIFVAQQRACQNNDGRPRRAAGTAFHLGVLYKAYPRLSTIRAGGQRKIEISPFTFMPRILERFSNGRIGLFRDRLAAGARMMEPCGRGRPCQRSPSGRQRRLRDVSRQARLCCNRASRAAENSRRSEFERRLAPLSRETRDRDRRRESFASRLMCIKPKRAQLSARSTPPQIINDAAAPTALRYASSKSSDCKRRLPGFLARSHRSP